MDFVESNCLTVVDGVRMGFMLFWAALLQTNKLRAN